ncbi:tetratricopeptide repeat-containing sulfotransferase family protein [Shewanella loihica]|uniref:Sulfotransferase n=1 Tax=Shewanella loihica (strain ATCC BAA-1088 / PV-4) TaxID=323850 RepID=A3QC46_SHELP|nr:tetratricopeptide repeat-containing sulfotransferase family protein [Shewanella loihica]ABO23044.1 sulfotransferase [Shewanella loihica PV-4]
MSREARYLEEARGFYQSGKFSSAGIYARKVIRREPSNGEAQALLGHLAFRSGEHQEAMSCYLKAQAAGFQDQELRLNLVTLHERREAFFDAVNLLRELVEETPQDLSLQLRLGINASRTGDMTTAESALLAALAGDEQAAQASLNLGHVYKAKGDTDKAAAFYHDYIRLAPSQQATAYWSLADLKNYRFTEQDEAALKANIAAEEFSQASQSLFHFALNRVYEQRKQGEQAFDAVRMANQLMRPLRPFKREAFTRLVDSLKSAEVKPRGEETSGPWTPIFIVGMPRSGTTLCEQILASHSQIAATDELPFMERLALSLEMKGGYGAMLPRLSEEQIAQMRQQYIEQVNQYLKAQGEASPSLVPSLVIDKNPNNFIHIGLIKTLFPEAKIINVIRDARDNAMGVYKQHFSHGHDYSYHLDDICHYWQLYLELMAHWQQAYGDSLYHLCFEQLVKAPDQQIPAMVDYVGLALEPACLKFYESKRSVLTPSASQVRRPMNVKAIGQSEAYAAFIPNAYRTLTVIADRAHKSFLS